MEAPERSWEMRDESRGDHAGRPTRCACDRAKRGLQWVWGRVGVFDPDFGFALEADSGSESESEPRPGPGEPGQIRMEGETVGVLEHLESLVSQGQSSRVVLKNRKQARQRWRRWRRLRKITCFSLAKTSIKDMKGDYLRRVPSTSMLVGERDNGREAGIGGSSCIGDSCEVSLVGLDSS